MNKTKYEVKLDIFEGPLDLLLFLIRKDKLDIYDIPIAHITDQFLKYLDLMKDLDLNVAADFIEMAAILMRIKVQMLLPTHETEDGVIEDPRDELVRQLVDYQRMKEAAVQLSNREGVQNQKYSRPDGLIPETETKDEEIQVEASLFDLFTAFIKIRGQFDREAGFHYVEKKEISIEDKMEFIIATLQFQKQMLFFDLFVPLETRISIVVTFMALLELLRLRQIRVRQKQLFGDIWIFPAYNNSNN